LAFGITFDDFNNDISFFSFISVIIEAVRVHKVAFALGTSFSQLQGGAYPFPISCFSFLILTTK
jgi:hypothetical protein